MARDIQRLPTIPFSLVLCKEYFDCPQRDSHAVHYIWKRVERGVCYTLVLCSLATETSCIDPSVRIVAKPTDLRRDLYLFSPSLWKWLNPPSYIYRVAAIFPKHFQSFIVGLKKTYFLLNLVLQTISAVCWTINKNKRTHSGKDYSTGSCKSRDSIWTSRRTYHEWDWEPWRLQ